VCWGAPSKLESAWYTFLMCTHTCTHAAHACTHTRTHTCTHTHMRARTRTHRLRTLTGALAYCDLSQDPELFEGTKGHPQVSVLPAS